MTQENITLLRSQNWYPAFRANEIPPNRVHAPEDFTRLHEYLNFAFSWSMATQGYGFWCDIYINLGHQDL